MKTFPLPFFAAVAFPLVLASCGPRLDVSGSLTAPAAPTKSDGTVEGELFVRVNAHRQSAGKSPLVRHEGLDRMARQHSQFMLKNRKKSSVDSLSHFGFEERSLNARRTMGMANLAENVATCSGGQSSAPGILMSAWKQSSGHERNMKGAWTVTGIGVAIGPDGTVYATQIFATRNHSHMATTERMRQF